MKAIATEIPKTNIKTKQINKIVKKVKTKNSDAKNEKNINFLDLLLKDIKAKQVNNTEIENNNSKDKKNGITKEIQELLKELLLDKNKNISNEIPNLNAVLNKVNFNQDIVKEIKNIITTNLKQQNILLTKTEINQFKKINNVTNLVKFANKKKLNIQKLTFKIVKNLKENPKLLNNIKQSIKPFKDINNKNQSKISTSQIIFTKKELANITPKINIPHKTNTKTNPKNSDKQISIKNIIQDNTKNDIKTSTNKTTQNKTTQNKTTQNKTTQSNLVADKTTQLNNHHNTKTNTIKQINLNSLLNNTKEKAEKTISHNSQKKSIDINTQINSDVNINEIKAKQVLAKDTINHFKNNLDEAIKNYKPPISKVNIELNPKNLGKVEVSIIQRGNNITLHMNTDQNNVILFQNHQAEFRQALSNIGFSNIDMNFNSNQEKEKRQNQAKKSYKNNSDDMDFSDIEIEANYKYA